MSAFDRLKKKLAGLEGNQGEKMENVWHKLTPYRPVGCFTNAPGLREQTPKYPRKIIIPARPLGDDPGDNAKQV